MLCFLLPTAMKQHLPFAQVTVLWVCVWAREEVREYESSCLCLYRLQSVFKGFNRIHSSIAVIIFPGCVCVLCVCVCSQKCLWKRGCFFSGAFKWTYKLCLASATGIHVRAAAMSVCVWPVAAMCHDIFHSTQADSVYYNEHILIFLHPYQSGRCYRIFCRGRNAVRGDEGFFSDCTRWMDVSVVIWITVCFVSRLWPFYRECEARSNLAKSVFHLSLEQTGAGELTPIYHQCEIPAPLIWS